MDRFHIERVPEDEGDFLLGTQIGEPIPRERALHADHQPLSVRCNEFQEPFWSRWDIPLNDRLALCAEDADVHGLCMEIDTTIERVLLSIESHQVSSL